MGAKIVLLCGYKWEKPNIIDSMRQATANGEAEFHAGTQPGVQPGLPFRTAFWVLAAAVAYYLATLVAWVLRVPDSQISVVFPPHAILVSVLLLVPMRHWWAYTLAAVCSHFIATQQAQWPPLYALEHEAFDAAKAVLTAAGIRLFIRSPFHLISLREAIIFVLIAVVIVPFGTAFWGAASGISRHIGAHYWDEWRRYGISNAVTTIVLVPVFLVGAHQLSAKIKVAPGRVMEACLLAVCIGAVGWLVFDHQPAGPDTSLALFYAPIPLLIWAALRFGLGGISASVLLITMLAIWGTMQGRGPFLSQTPAENALALQLFILMAATPLLLLSVAIDDERRSKAALRASEERMSATAESAQLALWDWDLPSDQIWIQDQGLFGFDPNIPIDHSTLAGHVHPDDRALRGIAIQRALANGGNYESEFRVILGDGSVHWLAARGSSASPATTGIPSRILGIAMDITLQKQAGVEAQLQREELAHLSRVTTLSALSGSFAHELGQPLSSILIDAEAGQRFMMQDAPDLGEIRAIFRDVVRSGRRAAEIIDRMRTLLRRGEVEDSVGQCERECLDELLRLTRGDLISRGVSVTNLATGDLPPALTDRVQLQQVLLNLIKNACDAMESNPPADPRAHADDCHRAERDARRRAGLRDRFAG
jgi:integral membrane sensor domain MASE1